jgi:hypothetical protein
MVGEANRASAVPAIVIAPWLRHDSIRTYVHEVAAYVKAKNNWQPE